MTNPRHLSTSNEAYTPAMLVEPARLVLGGIELDPASCALANETVRAERIYTREEDGLTKPWLARTVFVNPPGGKIGNEGQQATWWHRLARAWADGDVEAAIFISFSVELLQVAQGEAGLYPLDFPTCFPSSRVPYNRVEEDVVGVQAGLFDDEREPSRVKETSSPPHASAIHYLPAPNAKAYWRAIRSVRGYKSAGPVAGLHDRRAVARFKAAFSPIGRCIWTREGW